MCIRDRSHLKDAGGQPIDARRIVRIARTVRVVIGLRHHGDDLAGAHVENNARGGQRLELHSSGNKLVAQRVLHAQIEGKLNRILQPVGREPRQVQVVEALPVEPHLHAGDAFVVDIDIAHEVRNFGPVRVGARCV